MAVTGSDITAAPRRASARTMSRSLAIPSTAAPSCETTTAPIPCSARTARRRRTLVSGVTVTTWVPLTRRTSLIRIGPPRHQYAADRVPVPVPAGGRVQSRLPGSRPVAAYGSGTGSVGDPDGGAGGGINARRRACAPYQCFGAPRDCGPPASAGPGRDEQEPVPSGHDRPGAGVV